MEVRSSQVVVVVVNIKPEVVVYKREVYYESES
jgi:hypothetical protein